MAQHKAPTAVTIAPTHEKSGLALWIDQYWKHIAIVAVLVSGAILYVQYHHETKSVESDLSWEKLMSVASEDPTTRMLSGTPSELSAVEQQIRGQIKNA